MKVMAFAVYDRAASAYFAPFFQPTAGLGERNFGDLVQDPQSQLSKHPDDYELFLIGSYDNESGVLESHPPKLLLTGRQVLSIREVANG